ncbi:MAG: hypothetical protein J7498_13360 [Sphingobium sp.]|nr:hypothetical protein [Sphingobium sp.]
MREPVTMISWASAGAPVSSLAEGALSFEFCAKAGEVRPPPSAMAIRLTADKAWMGRKALLLTDISSLKTVPRSLTAMGSAAVVVQVALFESIVRSFIIFAIILWNRITAMSAAPAALLELPSRRMPGTRKS